MVVGKRPLGADDALRDSRLRQQEGTCNLLCCKTTDETQRQRHPRFSGERGMTRREDEAQQLVADVVIEVIIEIGRHSLPLDLDSAAKLLVLALDQPSAAQPVNGAMLGRGHQPGPGTVGDARLRPLLEGSDEGVLRNLLGEADIAHQARDASNQPRLLDPEDRVDRAMYIGGRHGHRSHHHPPDGASKSVGSANCDPSERPVYRLLALCLICWRVAVSRLASSGVNASGEKSEASKIGRSSHSPLPSTSRKRLVQWIASSIDFT